MTEKQANEILQKVGKYLFEKVKNISAISVVKLGKKEYDLKIIATPEEPGFEFDDRHDLDFQKEFNLLRERITISLQNMDFKLSKANFAGNKLPDELFQSEKLVQFKNPIRFLSPDPCEFCHTGGHFSLGLIIKRSSPRGKCYILFSAHSVENNSRTFNATRLERIDGVVVNNIRIISNQDSYDLAIAESDFESSFMKRKTSIVRAHFDDIIKHYGCATGMEINGRVISPNTTIRVHSYIIENIIELQINSTPGNSGAPVLNDSNKSIGLIHSGTDSGNEIDTTFCSNLYQAKKEHLLYPYYKHNSYYLATK